MKAAPFQSRASTAGAILITAPYILSSHELLSEICGYSTSSTRPSQGIRTSLGLKTR